MAWSTYNAAKGVRVVLLCGLALSLLVIPDAASAAGPAGARARQTPSRVGSDVLKRVLPERCAASDATGRPCADLADSVERWFGESGGFGGSGGSSTLALIVNTDAMVTSTTLGQDLTISLGGSGQLLSWHIGAGVLHAYDQGAYGFSLGAAVGLRVTRFNRWSIMIGAKFLNQTDFYGAAEDTPEQHILGELGASYDLPLSRATMMRFGLSVLSGVERRAVARFEGAREVIEDQTEFSVGGVFRIGLWIR